MRERVREGVVLPAGAGIPDDAGPPRGRPESFFADMLSAGCGRLRERMEPRAAGVNAGEGAGELAGGHGRLDQRPRRRVEQPPAVADAPDDARQPLRRSTRASGEYLEPRSAGAGRPDAHEHAELSAGQHPERRAWLGLGAAGACHVVAHECPAALRDCLGLRASRTYGAAAGQGIRWQSKRLVSMRELLGLRFSESRLLGSVAHTDQHQFLGVFEWLEPPEPDDAGAPEDAE
mmetsp:Transcript_63063/g.181408  ORF Transcript_63063/g.181408 Transcript_63063/m.181408 type:complete len:233 (+) Transcript_63063:583-1281(+)